MAVACAAILFSATTVYAATSFVTPTPANGSSQSHGGIEAKLSTSGLAGSFYSLLNFDDSLVGWYRLEGGGEDDSGVNHVSIWDDDGSGGEAYAAGKFGQAGDFDGHTSFDVHLTDPITTSFTISAWVNLRTITGGAALVSDSAGHVLQVGGSNRWQFDNVYSADSVATTGEWTLVTGVYDQAQHTETLYVNGAEVISGGGDRTIDQNINIGKRVDNIYIDGKIDDVTFFKRALGADEIASLYDGTNHYDHSFTTLDVGAHTLTGYVVDSTGAKDTTEERTVTVTNNTNITNCTELEAMRDNLAGSYALTSDIDCTGFDPNHDGKGFIPVGSASAPFAGSLNGNGHTISNLTIARPAEDDVGLFGYIAEGSGTGTFQNVTITGSIEGHNFTGALIGELEGTGSLVITNVYSSARILAHGYVSGGIIGQFESSGTITITNAHATGSVTVSATADTAQIGGLVGYISNGGVITGSTASGTVTVTSTGAAGQVGGLAGLFVGSTIASSSASGTVRVTGHVTNRIGGLIGGAGAGGGRTTMTASYATGDVIVSGYSMDPGLGGLVGAAGDPMDFTLCYSTGVIDLYSATYVTYGVGGIIGYDVGGGSINKSYSTGDITVEAVDNVSHGVSGLVGYTGADLSITDSFAERNISVTADTDYVSGAGGLLGWDEGFVVTIDRSYAVENITTHSATVDSVVGGLVGHLSNSASTISNSFFTGVIIATTATDDPEDNIAEIGGVTGDRDLDGAWTNVYWDKTRSGQEFCSGIDHSNPHGCTAIENDSAYFKGQHTELPLSLWNFTSTWQRVVDNYPNLLDLPPVNRSVVAECCGYGSPLPLLSFSIPPIPSSVVIVPPVITQPKLTLPFTRNLSMGANGQDVRALQQFLNTHGFIVSKSGLGSLGNETTVFSARTRAALIRFQVAHAIKPAAGFFGPATRGVVLASVTNSSQ